METLITEIVNNLADGKELMVESYPILRQQAVFSKIVEDISFGLSLSLIVIGAMILTSAIFLTFSDFEEEREIQGHKLLLAKTLKLFIIGFILLTVVRVVGVVLTPDLTFIKMIIG